MNHGKDCAHLYHEDGTLRDCMKPCIPEPTEAGDVEGCEDCGLSDCRTCGRTIRRCGMVREGCEFCTPFEEEPSLAELEGCDVCGSYPCTCMAKERMHVCPECRRSFPDSEGWTCPSDNARSGHELRCSEQCHDKHIRESATPCA